MRYCDVVLPAAMASMSLGTGILQAAAQATPQAQPNIVFIFADDQTPAYLSCYGGRLQTPALDSLASKGIRFTRAYSVTPLCNPTRFTTLTGQFPSRNAYCNSLPGAYTTPLQSTRILPGDQTVATLLKKQGYTTGYVGKWHSNFEFPAVTGRSLPQTPKNLNLDTPEAEKILKERQEILAEMIQKSAGFDIVTHVYNGNISDNLPTPLDTHHIEWLTDGAISIIDEAIKENKEGKEKKPFFLYVANTMPHSPDPAVVTVRDPLYTPSGKVKTPSSHHPARSTVATRLKAAGLPVSGQLVGALMLDDQVAAIIKALDERGLLENTLIVYAQDNGQLGKGSVYLGGSHSAFLMQWPEKIAPAQVCNQDISFVDILPTFVAAAGGTIPTSLDGINILPATEGKTLPRSAVFLECGSARSVISGDYQYIAFRPLPSQIEEMKSGKVSVALDTWGNTNKGDNQWTIPYKPAFFDPDQLYNIANDPLERHNLIADPALAPTLAKLKSELANYLATFKKPFPSECDPFVQSPEYKTLVAARQAACRQVDYWPGFPTEDWEYNLNHNKKTPEEIDPTHRSGFNINKYENALDTQK